MTSLLLLLLTACGDKADEDTSVEDAEETVTEQSEEESDTGDENEAGEETEEE